MKKILITGGAGFIGSNFINFMYDNHKFDLLICLDKLTYAGNVDYLNKIIDENNFVFIEGDISDKILLDKIFKEYTFDLVVNFAAESHVDRSLTNPDAFMKSNFIGVFNLLECIKKYGNCRLHQVSTDEVYGDLSLDSDYSFKETDLLKPSSPYSASKAASDLLILSYYKSYGLDVTISRSTNNFGKYQYPEKLIPLVINKIMNNQKIPVYGNGMNIRDWIFVDDHCSAILKIATSGISGEIYNVGSNNKVSNINLINVILEAFPESKSKVEYVSDRLGHDLMYSVDSNKLRALGWEVDSNFEDKLNETIDWYRLSFSKKTED